MSPPGQGSSASSLKPLCSDSLCNARPINLEKPNKMDEKLFFELNIMDFNEAQVEELKSEYSE